MKKNILTLFVLYVIVLSFGNLEKVYGENMNKININNVDKENIKRIANNYLNKFISFVDQSELKSFYAKELWATGGEKLQIKVIDGFSLKKISTRKDDDFGIFVKQSIEFRVIGVVNQDGYQKVNLKQNRLLGFIFEDNIWKIKSIFSSIYFSKEGAIKWANRFKNSNDKEFSKVANLILSNLK